MKHVFLALLATLALLSCSDKNVQTLSLEGVKDFDLQKTLEQSKALNKPVLICFSSIACMNCRKMEEGVLKDPNVIHKVRKDFIFIPLNVDDRTEARKALWRKSIVSEKILKRVGHLNSELQIRLSQSGSQPYFVVLNDDEEVISRIGYSDNADDFMTFLNTAIEN